VVETIEAKESLCRKDEIAHMLRECAERGLQGKERKKAGLDSGSSNARIYLRGVRRGEVEGGQSGLKGCGKRPTLWRRKHRLLRL